MRSSFILIVICFGALTLLGQNNPIDTSRVACVEKANLLLDEAFVLIQKNYYRKDSVDWKPLLESAKHTINQSSDCASAYRAVQWCFDQIQEKHSFIMPPVKAAMYTGNINSSKSGVTHKPLTGRILHELIESDIAYISVPWVSTTDQVVCTRFADSIQSLIQYFDQLGVSKWIIDLRKNTGGNCWPMLAGVGPLLGNGVHGFFVSPKEFIPITYKDGIVMQGKKIRCIATDPHTMSSRKKTIIVLTGKNTSSAGEIVALAFKGLNNVYLYGEPTAGLTTANASYPLSDGSLLVLTVCKEADRKGTIIEGQINPDEFISTSSGRDDDAIKTAAVMFLQLQ